MWLFAARGEHGLMMGARAAVFAALASTLIGPPGLVFRD
jgi:hypothetical protein